MGSFNATCFASQQTIAPGEKVVLIPIVQALGNRSVIIDRSGRQTEVRAPVLNHCYPTAFWEFSGPLIYATYYDYGYHTLDEDEENLRCVKTLLDYVFEKVEMVKTGDEGESSFDFATTYNPSKTYEPDELLEVFQSLWDAADRDENVFLNNVHHSHTGPVNFKFAVILQDSVEYLVDMVRNEETYGQQMMNEDFFITEGIRRSGCDYFIEDFVERAKLESTINEDSSIIKYLSTMSGVSYADFGAGAYGIMGTPPSTQEVMELVNELTLANKSDYKKILTDYIKKFQNRKIKAGMLMHGLDMISARIVPQTYTTQDYDNTIGNKYLQFVTAVNAKVNSRVSSDDQYIDQTDGG